MSDAYFEQLGISVIHTNLAGVSFYDRPANIRQCRDGDLLDMIREPNNQHDPNAIRVEDSGKMLGYIPRALAVSLAKYMDACFPIVNCRLEEITGGGDLNYGVNISVEVYNIAV